MNNLTPRQTKALQLVAEGFSVDEAAEEMHVSKSTLEKHLSDARERLNARNLRNAIYLAAKRGLIVWCCVALYDADELRRPVRVRLRRREGTVELVGDDFN